MPRLMSPTLVFTMPQCRTTPPRSHNLSASSSTGTNLPKMPPKTAVNVKFG